jgi:Abnormal spindle-like microcephaly-assoc'd, ASPM-SPD-2-Hydin
VICRGSLGIGHTAGMRLPQSLSRISISASIITIIGLLTLAVLPSAGAATKQLEFSPSSLRFGDVTVGQSESQLVTLTNTGQSSVTISGMTVGSSEFTVTGLSLPVVLAASQTVSFNVNFAPTQKGWAGANIAFSNTSSSPNLRLQAGGSATNGQGLSASPASLSFGQVAVGTSTSQTVVLTNPFSWKVTLNALQSSGGEFSVSGPSFPLVLNPGKSVSLTVAFAPTVTAIASGSVFISGPQLNIPLTGSGSTTTTGQLSISPASLSFGSVDVGSSTTLPASLTATGGSVTINAASSSNSQYSIPGVSFPFTINAGQSVSVNVAFAPTKSGTDNGTLTFSSSTSSSSAESMTGSGVVPQYSVTLSWSGSTSSVAGYNVYRGTTAGSYSKINSSLDPNTSYSDSTVASGVTYYYAATAVNSSGEESGYSSPVEVAVP